MAESQQPWLKTLRRFGSRLSLHGPRRSSSVSAESDRWLARYDHRRSTSTTDNDAAYATSVELVRLDRDDDGDDGGGQEDESLENADSAERKKSDRERRLAAMGIFNYSSYYPPPTLKACTVKCDRNELK